MFQKPGRKEGVVELRFFITENLSFKIRDDLSFFTENIFENLLIEVSFSKHNRQFFCNYYRPNNHHILTSTQQINEFFELLSQQTEILTSLNHPVYILSDSNIDLLKPTNKNISSQYFELLTIFGFLPLISKATRFQDRSMSAIDHIFTNKEMPSYRSGVITDQLFDHMYSFFELNKVKLIYPPNQRFEETRLINKDSVKLFNDALIAQFN